MNLYPIHYVVKGDIDHEPIECKSYWDMQSQIEYLFKYSGCREITITKKFITEE